MNRSLVAILALSAISFLALASTAFAWSRSDGARGRAILRLHGGTVHPDPDPGAGPGWLAGGALGVGVTQNFLILANYDHIYVDQPGRGNRVTLDPVTIQFELGKRFQGRVSPRLEVGGGVYVRSRPPAYYPSPEPPSPNASQSPGTVGYGIRADSPFGMNMGGGISFLLSERVMLDLGARYHQTMGSRDTLILTTVTAGLTIGLSSGAQDGDEYIERENETAGSTYARR